MRQAGVFLLLVATLAVSVDARINAGFRPEKTMPAGWCNLQIPGCNLCHQEEAEMAPGAEHPGHEGPQPPVMIVRCFNCSAPLYVYNEDNENCDCASGAGSVYRNGTFVDAEMELFDEENVTLSDIFPPGDLNRPPPTQKATTPPEFDAFSLMSSADTVPLEIMMADAPSGKLGPAIELQRTKSDRPIKLNRFVISNPDEYSVTIAVAADNRLGARRFGRRGRVTATQARVSAARNDATSSDDSDANNYGGGYSNGNGYGYSYSGKYKDGHNKQDEDKGGKGPKYGGAWWSKLSHEGKKGRKHNKHYGGGSDKVEQYYQAEDESFADYHSHKHSEHSHDKHGEHSHNKGDEHTHSKHAHGDSEGKHWKKKEHHADHSSKHEDKYGDDDGEASHGKHHHHGPWHSEDDGDDRHGSHGGAGAGGDDGEDDGDNAGPWKMVDPEQLVCGACPPNSVSKGGLIGGTFCQRCKVDEVADQKKQICKPAKEADDEDEEEDGKGDDGEEDTGKSKGKHKASSKGKKGHKSHNKHSSDSNKHTTHHKHSSSKQSKKHPREEAKASADDAASANGDNDDEGGDDEKAEADSAEEDAGDDTATDKKPGSGSKAHKASTQGDLQDADTEDATEGDKKEQEKPDSKKVAQQQTDDKKPADKQEKKKTEASDNEDDEGEEEESDKGSTKPPAAKQDSDSAKQDSDSAKPPAGTKVENEDKKAVDKGRDGASKKPDNSNDDEDDEEEGDDDDVATSVQDSSSVDADADADAEDNPDAEVDDDDMQTLSQRPLTGGNIQAGANTAAVGIAAQPAKSR